MILTICLFIFVPQRIRSFMFRRNHLPSSNEFNYRYQLLTSFSAEDVPPSSSTYSNIKRL